MMTPEERCAEIEAALSEHDHPGYLAEITWAIAEIRRLRQWVHDLQAGMYINCVYCGHRYGPDDQVPATMAQALKEHVERCPEHPMAALREERDRLRTAMEELEKARGERGVDRIRAELDAMWFDA